ncbi:MAG: 2,3-bisphosphoglycerate-dependent phosphoglycerate mutase [Candidatus Staskawiczbacteria bacterium]|nr:2,3-bisphosphoglycerate-dependent phosphoglycerate mutase [Candidatus Staskawiczbacteria bacterium]
MAKLILLRHFQSQWNKDNRFAGWVDNPLSQEGILQAKEVADKLSATNIEVVYTSPLIRNQETVLKVFEDIPAKYPLFLHLDGGKMQKWANFVSLREIPRGGTEIDKNNIPVFVSENLNERYYGELQGLNKEEVIKKYGDKMVHLWRRGFKESPPKGESLKDVFNRAVPFYKKYIEKDLKQGKNILLVASHNSLRALVKYIEEISDQDIANVELPFGALLEYEFDNELGLKSKKYFS